MSIISFRPIGVINTPHKQLTQMPIQPNSAQGIKGFIELDIQYLDGLLDLEGFSHITLLYHLHKVTKSELRVTPFMDTKPHGIFATRSPIRPNPIGLSTVKLISIQHNRIYIEGVDMLNGSPLLDIKPFFGDIDNRYNTTTGWLSQSSISDPEKNTSDTRFL